MTNPTGSRLIRRRQSMKKAPSRGGERNDTAGAVFTVPVCVSWGGFWRDSGTSFEAQLRSGHLWWSPHARLSSKLPSISIQPKNQWIKPAVPNGEKPLWPSEEPGDVQLLPIGKLSRQLLKSLLFGTVFCLSREKNAKKKRGNHCKWAPGGV